MAQQESTHAGNRQLYLSQDQGVYTHPLMLRSLNGSLANEGS